MDPVEHTHDENTGAICPHCAEERKKKWQKDYENLVITPGLFVQAQVREENIGEHLWFKVLKVEGGVIVGELCNEPVLLKDYKIGATVPFFREDIEQHSRAFKVGDIVELRFRAFLGEQPGTRAYIYEEYQLGGGGGFSVITENGVDLGGFSYEEADMYLTNPVFTGYSYSFSNVMKLSSDFDRDIQPLFDKK